MTKINPEISQKFLEEIKNQNTEIVDIDGVKIKTCKGVFPPRSNFSKTSEKLHKIFGNLKGMSVLDVGTGTGVQAVQAIKEGASTVIALDVNPAAVFCAKDNIKLNGVEDRVTVLESDLFSSLRPAQKFDVIIANLPISDFPLEGFVESALYDPEYKLHKRFFSEVSGYLNPDGFIVMTHTNFKGENDFEEFEKMLLEHNLGVLDLSEVDYLGYIWRTYKIKSVVS